MDRKDNNKKIISLSITLFIVMLLVSGGSFAYWTWVTADSERTGVAFNVSAPDMSASLDGHSVTVTNLIPISSCTDETYAIKKQLTLTYENNSTNAGEILGTLSIEEDSFISPHGTPDSDDLSHLHYAVTTSPDNCTAEPLEGMSGTFTETSGQLFSSQKLVGPIPAGTDETSMTFYLWVWLDSEYTHQNVGSGVSNDPMQDISFTLVWSGEIKNDLPIPQEPNAPVLDDGMIPVTIANDGTVTTVANDDSSWYNYDNKEWANVVLVNEEATADVEGSQSREYYENNLSNNVEVNQSDILAYYVWIPRYKYKIWDVTGTSSPQTINIEYESKVDEPILGTAVGEWRTHPAFIWDENTISGIWVGKFETTGNKTTPTILPNNNPFIKQNISTQFATSLKFAGGSFDGDTGIVTFTGSNTYGLTANTDSHMMKNSEWGAVVYLSHSEYGINGQIRLNNYGKEPYYIFMTGCGASEEDVSVTAECQIVYGGASSYPQSTTGNINGVFDMSGGVWDNVMGNYKNIISYADFVILPDSKYYDLYTSETELTACDSRICYGHAMSETKKWYNNHFQMFQEEYGYTWFKRGGSYSGALEGVFTLSYANGFAGNYNSWRSVLVIE